MMEKSRISFAQNLSIAYECALAIGSSLNLAEMLHQVIHTIAHKTNALRGIIWVKEVRSRESGEGRDSRLVPAASAGIRISDALSQERIISLGSVFKQMLPGERFVLITKDDEDFSRYLGIQTGREEAVLIVPVNNVAVIHLVYAGRERVDEPLGNLLAGLSPRLSVAIDACVAHENIIKEIRVREETESELRKKTDEVISSQEELQRLYAESEKARESLLSILEDVSEKENTLRESEKKYRSLIDQSQDAIHLLYEGNFEIINQRFEELFGYTLEEANAPDFHFMNLEAPKSRPFLKERAEKIARGETVSSRYEFTALSRDGTEIEVETSISYINYKGGIAAQGITRDITERKRAEERIQHLTDVLRAIRNVNQLITREKDRDRLIKGVCDTLIETRGYHYCWVAIFHESRVESRESGEEDSRLWTLDSVAEAGFGEDFPPFLKHLRRGNLPICGTRALRESGVVVIEDTLLDCPGCLLSEKSPGRSSMIVRLEHEGKVYGLLSVSSTIDLAVDEEERTLFQEVADDIAFALHSIELEEARQQAEEATKKAERKYRSLVTNVKLGIYRSSTGPKGKLLEVNPAMAEILGCSGEEELLRMNAIDFYVHPEEREILTEEGSVIGEEQGITREMHLKRKDGTEITVADTMVAVRDEAGRVLYFDGIIEDITERKRAEREIEEQREYLVTVLRDVPDAIVTLDTANLIVEWNPGAERLFGYTYDEVQGERLDDLITRPDVKEQAISFSKQVLSGKELPSTEVVRYRKDSTPIDVLTAGSPIIIGDKVVGSVAVYTDITERKRAEKALEGAKQKIESLHEIAHHLAICETAENAYQLTVEAAERILEFSICTLDIVEEDRLVVKATSSGLPPEASVGRPLDEGGLAAKTYRSGETIVFSSMDEVPEATPTAADFKSGISAPIGDIGVFQVVSTQAAAFSEDDALLLELLLGHTVETVKRIRLQEELKEQAIRDPLTGVYNRRYFTETIAQEVVRSTRYDRPIAFLMIDVNRFKEINDRFGHQTGDRVLKEIANLLQEQVRESDTVIRYGGDEFLVILPETNGETKVVKERITAAVARRNKTNELIDFPITLAIGSAFWTPGRAESVEEILVAADRRMYEAKREHDSGDQSE